MEIDTVDIISLGERHLGALAGLLAAAFVDEPMDLLLVEIERARDPRLGQGFVAERSGEPVGVVLARQPRGGSLFVIYLAVAGSLRRCGVARWLLDQLTEASGDRLEMFVDEGNVAAERLYRAGGLEPVEGPAPQGQRRWAGTWQPRRDGALPAMAVLR